MYSCGRVVLTRFPRPFFSRSFSLVPPPSFRLPRFFFLSLLRYWTLKGCPYSDPTLVSVAEAHNSTSAAVCVSWVLGRGVVVAAGTGSDAEKISSYTHEDLGATSLVLTPDEMDAVGKAGLAAASKAASKV